MATIDASATASVGHRASASALVLPAVDFNKVRRFIILEGTTVVLMQGELGAVLDVATLELNASYVNQAWIKISPMRGASITVPAYVSADGYIRRVLDGSESLAPGLYRAWPIVKTDLFTGPLRPFFIQVEEVAA